MMKMVAGVIAMLRGAAMSLAVVLFASAIAYAQSPIMAGPLTPTPTLGSCDIVACAEAWSVTRRMVSSYTGPLFQLNNGSSTLDIGQTSAHQVDMTTWSAFCGGVPAGCTISKVYAQIHTTSNDLTPFNSSNPSVFTIEAATGLPIWISVNTGSALSSQAYTVGGSADNVSTGINASGTAETIISNSLPASVTNTTGGSFGTAHKWNAACCTAGTDFMIFQAFGFGPTPPGGSCITPQTYCVGIDEECQGNLCSGGFFDADTSDYTAVPFQGAVFAITYDPVANKCAVYVNGVQLVNQTPPMTYQSGQFLHYGGGGDLSGPAVVQNREMLITNTTLSQTQVAAVTNNMKSFYTGVNFPSGPNNPAIYAAGPGNAVSGATYFNSFRAYTAAIAAAGTQTLIAVANRTSSEICNILVNAAGGLGNTTGCTGSSNGKSIQAFCTTPVAANTNHGQPEMDCQMQEVFDQVGNVANYVNLGSPAAYFAPYCINFTPCAVWGNTSTAALGATITLSSVSQPYTVIELAGRVPGTGGSGAVVISHEGSSSSTFFAGFLAANNAFIQTNTSGTFPTISASATDGSFHTMYGIFNGSSSSLTVDGTTTTGSLGSDAAGTNPKIRWANRSAGDLPLTGQISETGLYPFGLTATQQTNLRANQRAYWGF